MSCAANNATSGGGKVLSVARLEMVKYVTKGSKSSYLEDNYRVSGYTEIGRPMTVLSTVRARARRWNGKGDTISKACKGVITSL